MKARMFLIHKKETGEIHSIHNICTDSSYGTFYSQKSKAGVVQANFLPYPLFATSIEAVSECSRYMLMLSMIRALDCLVYVFLIKSHL